MAGIWGCPHTDPGVYEEEGDVEVNAAVDADPFEDDGEPWDFERDLDDDSWDHTHDDLNDIAEAGGEIE